MEPKELSFVPKYHHQLVVGVNAGKWMSGVSYEVIRLAVQEACRIVAEGHSVLVVDREGSNVVTDEEQRQRRMQSFAVRAEATREPEFEGEKMISVTYNGRQWYPMSLAPHEAHKLLVLLRAEFPDVDPQGN